MDAPGDRSFVVPAAALRLERSDLDREQVVETDEVLVVISGRATVTLADGSTLELTPGDVARPRPGPAVAVAEPIGQESAVERNRPDEAVKLHKAPGSVPTPRATPRYLRPFPPLRPFLRRSSNALLAIPAMTIATGIT